MNCHDIEERITPYLLGDLEPEQAASVKAHLEACESCRALAEDLESTLGLLHGALAADTLVAPTRLDPERHRRIRHGKLPTPLFWFVLHGRVLANAAVILVCVGLLTIFLLPQQAGPRQARTGPTMEVAMVEAEPAAELEEFREETTEWSGRRDARHREMLPVDALPAPTAPAPPAPDLADLDVSESIAPPAKTRGFYAGRTTDRLELIDPADSASRHYQLSLPAGDASPPAAEPVLAVKTEAGSLVTTYDGTHNASGLDGGGSMVAGNELTATRRESRVTTLGRLKSEHDENFDSGYSNGEVAGRRDNEKVPVLGTLPMVGDLFFDEDKGRRAAEAGGQTYDFGGGAGGGGGEKDGDRRGFGWAYKDFDKETKKSAEKPTTPALQFAGKQVAGEEWGRRGGEGKDEKTEMVPLQTTLPKARFVSTPVPLPLAKGLKDEAQHLSQSGPLHLGAEDGSYVVREGDNLFNIAQRQKTSIDKLAELNSLDDPNTIRVGQRLTLPGGSQPVPAAAATTTWGLREANEESRPSVFKASGFNPYVETATLPFSTFSIDVDTAAYTLARKYILAGQRPPAEAVRTEEFVNAFEHAYRAPERDVFGIAFEAAPTPFGEGHLLKIGVKGRRLGREEQRAAVLTFVIDTSGSMNTPDRLGLVKRSLHLLVNELAPQDRVALVQYGSRSRLLLAHTPAAEAATIHEAIKSLQASGSTHLEEGLRLGYEIAGKAFASGAANRVLLLSDGMANLGSDSAETILEQVGAYRKQGVYCSIFGFGIGNYNDPMLETLANKGDGVYHFIDSLDEAKRVFVDDLAATLNVIAGDVKIQVQFDPRRVRQYRQLGYENRQLTREQFRDDTVDAGEVGSGQSVTALYEVSLQGNRDRPIGIVRIRYRDAATGQIEEIERPLTASSVRARFEDASVRFRLAACVAEFAEILRGSPFAAGSDLGEVARTLRPAALELHLDAQVQELLRLVGATPGR